MEVTPQQGYFSPWALFLGGTREQNYIGLQVYMDQKLHFCESCCKEELLQIRDWGALAQGFYCSQVSSASLFKRLWYS